MDQAVLDALKKWPNVPACTGWLMLDRRGQWRMRDEACQASGGSGDPIRHTALNAFIARNYAVDDEGRWFFQNGPQRVFVDLAYTPSVVRLSLETAAPDAMAFETLTEVSIAPEPSTEVATSALPRLTDQCGRRFQPLHCWFDDEGNVLFSGYSETSSSSNGPLGEPLNTPLKVTGNPHTDFAAAPIGKNSLAAPSIALLHDHDLALFAEHTALSDESALNESSDTPVIAGADGLPAFLQWTTDIALPLQTIAAKDVPLRFAFAQRPQA